MFYYFCQSWDIQSIPKNKIMFFLFELFEDNYKIFLCYFSCFIGYQERKAAWELLKNKEPGTYYIRSDQNSVLMKTCLRTLNLTYLFNFTKKI